ncbi:MAG: MATE family efflux transporter [Lentisphaeraceae bacterium]|nr:MATE family efflux transporter [Lentisphaeraceae bacterium]
MIEPDDNSKLLSEGPVSQALNSIMVPMAIMMVTNVGFSYLDAWYISRLGENALSAIDISFPLVNLCSAILYGGLGTGVSAAVARRQAKNDQAGCQSSLKMGFLLAIPLALFFTFGIVLAKDQIFSIADNEAIKEMAYEYCFWYFLPVIIMAWGAVTSSAMRGAGYAKKPAIYSLICMGINGILTPLFSFDSLNLGFTEIGIGFDMGIKGAALSTVIAYTVFSLFLLKDLIKGSQGFKFFEFKLNVDRSILKAIFVASAIAALLPMMTNIVIFIVLKFMKSHSVEIQDAFSLAKRFELYAIQLTVCLGAATMVVIGASHENHARVKEILVKALKMLFYIGVPITIFMAFSSSTYYSTLTLNGEILEEGQRYFLYGGLNMLFTCAIILLNFAFQGMGKPAAPIPFSLTSVILIQGVIGIALLNKGYSTAFYYGLISAGATVTFALILIRFFRMLESENAN